MTQPESKGEASFAIGHKYSKRRDASYVKIMVEPPKPGSWWCDAFAMIAAQYALLAEDIEPIVWKMSVNVAKAMLFSRSGNYEINDRLLSMLEESLKDRRALIDANLMLTERIDSMGSALTRYTDPGIQPRHEDKIRDQLMEVIHKLIDNNQAAVKKATRPIGDTCSAMCVGDRDEAFLIDEAMASAIQSNEEITVMDSGYYTVRFDSITLHTGACKLEVMGEEGRYISGKITDPEFSSPNNKYTNSLNTREPLRVHAKGTSKGGQLRQLFIFDA